MQLPFAVPAMLKVIYGMHVVIVTPSISCTCNQVAPSTYQLITFRNNGYVGLIINCKHEMAVQHCKAVLVLVQLQCIAIG